ncbi:MAG: N-acetyltransferase family protein [Candidatus Woesearchaeota archaeon]
MNIRVANKNDLDKLTNIFIDFKEELTAYEPEDIKVFRRNKKPFSLIKQAVSKKITDTKGMFLLAEEGNQVIGFGFATLKENDHVVFKTVRYGFINNMWVHKSYRGEGIASKIKNELFSWFKKNNCGYVELSVLDTNPAKKMYEKWGFEVTLTSMKKVL